MRSGRCGCSPIGVTTGMRSSPAAATRQKSDACTRDRSWSRRPYVEFVGFVEEEELIRLLSSADVCLAPEPKNALNDASTMIKVVEYMGMGRPSWRTT